MKDCICNFCNQKCVLKNGAYDFKNWTHYMCNTCNVAYNTHDFVSCFFIKSDIVLFNRAGDIIIRSLKDRSFLYLDIINDFSLKFEYLINQPMTPQLAQTIYSKMQLYATYT